MLSSPRPLFYLAPLDVWPGLNVLMFRRGSCCDVWCAYVPPHSALTLGLKVAGDGRRLPKWPARCGASMWWRSAAAGVVSGDFHAIGER